ncbi:Protein AIM2 [Escovopsis weberi]|uniref:Protein AIM2 n=1 Tax=Escovopsis weberi TaxID=150374 RepID=A0A0M8MWK1_ESCWE|nr:Protein AIM2 [Escovopsis weberi]
MSDSEVATKAPESDAQGDAPRRESHVAGEHCVTDRPTPIGQGSTGEIIKINDVDVYISKPADYPHSPCRLLLLLTGGTGIHSTNHQIQADRYAAEGFLVLMPDMFGGDAAPEANSTTIPDSSSAASLLERFKMGAVSVTKAFLIDMWLARVTEDKVMPILLRAIEGAHEHYGDVVRNGDGIYAVGYCIGARYVLLLAKGGHSQSQSHSHGGSGDGDEESRPVKAGPFIKAGALAHAASVEPGDFDDLRVPLNLVCVENDSLFPDKVRIAGEEAMTNADLEHEVTVYPGVPHGFAVVGQYQDAAIQDAQATAFEQMLHWIKEH